MQYIIDILLVVIFALIVFFAAKKGFFMSLFELGAYIISLIASKLASSALAPVIYESVFQNQLTQRVENTLGSVGKEDYATKISDSINAIPTQFDGILEMIGIDRAQLADSISSSEFAGKNVTQNVMDKVISPVTTAIIQTLLFIILSVVITFILRLIIRSANKMIKKLPVLKQVNSSLGAVIGIVKGMIAVVLIALIIGSLSGVFNSQQFVKLVNSSIIVHASQQLLDSISGYKFQMV